VAPKTVTALGKEAFGVQMFDVMLYASTVAVAALVDVIPPIAKIKPFGAATAWNCLRAVDMVAPDDHSFVWVL